MSCLVIITCLCQGLQIKLDDGTMINGSITGKDNTYYYIETDFDQLVVPINTVEKILDGETDLTIAFYRKSGFTSATSALKSKQPTNLSLLDLSPYEREMLLRFDQLNRNTGRISSTMWNIFGVSIGISIASILLINAL